jgi:glycoside/pentoside/hexuronide:cation symporter, GPH family
VKQQREVLSVQEKIGYGLGDFAANIIFQTVMIFLMYFYTDIFGIPVAAVGTLFLLARIWDAINDPLMGSIADRTRSKHGRFRPWIRWTALPFGIMAVLMFSTPDFGVTGKIIYAYVTYILMMMIYTANNVPYGALSAVMTSDSVERTSLNSYRFVLAMVAGLVIQGLTLPLVGFLGGENKALGYQLTMAIFATLAVVFFLITFYSTRERIEPPKSQATPIKDDLKDLVHNRPWVILFFMGLITFIFLSLRLAVGLYYFQYYVGDEGLFTMFALLGTVGMILGIPLSKPLTRKFGKKRTYIASNALAGLAIIGLFFPAPDQYRIAYLFSALVGFLSGPGVPILWAMYADVADYAEWKFGRRATGIIFSAATFGQKFGWGIGGALTGWLLAAFHYVPNADQTPEALLGIKLMLSIIPGTLMLLSIIFLFYYNLSESFMMRIQTELADRREAGED